MTEDYQEGIEELSDEALNPELRGLVIDLDKDRQRKFWLASAVAIFIVLLVCGWSYWFLTRSTEDLLSERLKNRMEVSAMLREVRRIVPNAAASTEELIAAIDLAIKITDTPLRQGTGIQATLIPERQQAMIEAIHGLIRLELEKGFDTLDPSKTYANLLNRLGEKRLEYFENGVVEWIPLIEYSWTAKKIQNEQANSSFIDEETLASLESELRSLESEEGFTVAEAAYTLGRWYRYYNDMEQAERCFELTRSYVEGYEFGQVLYNGRRPKKLNRFWNVYVGCIEALAESRMQSKHFREARSYLTRIYHTPSSRETYNSRYQLSRTNPLQAQHIKRVEKDIKSIEHAIATPLLIPQFPNYSEDQIRPILAVLSQQVRQAGQDEHSGVLGQIWEALSEPSRLLIRQSVSNDEEETRLSQELVAILNSFVNSTDFHRQISYNPKQVSSKAQEILKQAESYALSKEETQFVNRELIDLALGLIDNNQFILSDGTRISSKLSSKQLKQYYQLAEMLLNDPYAKTELKKQLAVKVRSVRNNELQPGLSDLQQLIVDLKQAYEDQIAETEQVIETQKTALQVLGKSMAELEKLETVDLARIAKLHQRESRARELQAEARRRQEKAQDALTHLGNVEPWITDEFRQQLATLEKELKYLKNQEAKLPQAPAEDEEALLSQLEEQITLRNKYLELLKGLQATGGERELQRIRIEKSRLEGEIAVLEEQIASSAGNEREVLEISLAEREASRHALLMEFDRLYNPLREVVQEIASREEEVWQTELQLRATREEILRLVGTPNHPGLLEERSERLSELLLKKSQDAINTPLYDAEIRRLNHEVAEAHGRLNVLLQKESQARSTLQAFYPHSFKEKLLFAQEGDLSPLHQHLVQQEKLMNQYQTLWKMGELYRDLQLQERIILENLRNITAELDLSTSFSQEQTQNITRFMQGLLEARKRMRRDQHLLRELAKGHAFQESIREISGRGYVIDSIEMFQLEHQIGLNISEYRRAFDERSAILDQLRKLLAEKQILEQEKIQAAQRRDQSKIDALIPLVAEKDSLIDLLSQKQLQVNERLRQLSLDYQKRLANTEAFREKTRGQMLQFEQRIQNLSQDIANNDHQLESIVKQVFETGNALKKSLTALTEHDLISLQSLIETQEREIERLIAVRDLKKCENYYKSKALYWMAKTFYEQSRLPSFEALVKSHSLPDSVGRDEERNAKLLYEEFDLANLEAEHEVISKAGNRDENQAAYLYWVESLEKNALRIFHHDLPKHIPPEVLDEKPQAKNLTTYVQDSQAFVARSRFLSGQIYLKRALRYIRNSHAPSHKNERAKKELDQAITSFMSFLDFTRPFAYINGINGKLTEARMGSQEFPFRQRFPIHLEDEAGIYLGICSSLKDEHHHAIDSYREILSTMMARSPEVKNVRTSNQGALGQLDPILVQQPSYSSGVYPVYAALLARYPQAHEAIYRLGRSYHALAEEQFQLELEHSYLPKESVSHFRQRFEDFSKRALAYYGQVVNTQAYSSFRRAALLQRALLYKRLGQYHQAQSDLLGILGIPEDKGGSWEHKDLTPKGDLPGELNPGYAYVSFELGKLHLENQNFSSAMDAFAQAKEGDPEQNVVLQAKIAYADTLIQSRSWLMADILLKELTEERRIAIESKKYLYPPEIMLNWAEVKQHLGDIEAALSILKQVYSIGPEQLVTEEGLKLSDRYAIILLEQEFRDAIRPMAEACLKQAELYLRQRNYIAAKKAYEDAEILFKRVPWQQDRKLRLIHQPEYIAYKQEQVLKCRWGLLQCDTRELLFSSFSPWRKRFETLRFTGGPALDPGELLETIDETLHHVSDLREDYLELLVRLNAFKEAETEQLPEVRERERILQQRNIDRKLGKPNAQRYDALARIRSTLETVSQKRLSLNVDAIAGLFTPKSFENAIVNEFALLFAKEFGLTEADRKQMLPHQDNIHNLKAIPNAKARLANFPFAFQQWIEREMQATGLDDVFIPVSQQARILEDVDLYRVSLLSHIEGAENYHRIVGIVDDYLEEMARKPSRISDEEKLWQMVNIAALSAEHYMDWEKVADYNRYLLDSEQQRFFLKSDRGDYYSSQLSLARSLIQLSQKISTDLIFMQDEMEQLAAEKKAQKQLDEAADILRELAAIQGNESSAVTTRVQAKQILNQLGA